MRKVEIELYHTSEKLPDDNKYVHWLTKHGYWTSGYYNVQSGRFAPGFFQSHSGVLYDVCDGHTWWTPELPIMTEGEK